MEKQFLEVSFWFMIPQEFTQVHKVVETSRIIRGIDCNVSQNNHDWLKGYHTINQYSIIKDLGAGAFGEVKLVHKNETLEKFVKFLKSIMSLAGYEDLQKEYAQEAKGVR